MIAIRTNENGVGEYLASPLSSHLIAYTPSIPVSTLRPVVEGVTTPAQTAAIPQPPPAQEWIPQTSGIEASLGLNQETSLTGGVNSPPTPAESNLPGLKNQTVSATVGVDMKSPVMILLIIAVVAGLIYYYNPGNILKR